MTITSLLAPCDGSRLPFGTADVVPLLPLELDDMDLALTLTLVPDLVDELELPTTTKITNKNTNKNRKKQQRRVSPYDSSSKRLSTRERTERSAIKSDDPDVSASTVAGDDQWDVCLIDEAELLLAWCEAAAKVDHDQDHDELSSTNPEATVVSQAEEQPLVSPVPRALRGSLCMDAVSLLAAMIHHEPLAPSEVRASVEETCRDMVTTLAEPDWELGFSSARCGLLRGWRMDTACDSPELPFRLSQQFATVSARELLDKTWTLLTSLEGYRQIQPQVQQLTVLQRIGDDSCVVALRVASGSFDRYAFVLVARAVVHGGFLVTFRSLPLVRPDESDLASEASRQRYLEHETGSFQANIFAWYNFQERPANRPGVVRCEVTFGGRARNTQRHVDYLKHLYPEVLSGFARWQSAVGFSHFLFGMPLATT